MKAPRPASLQGTAGGFTLVEFALVITIVGILLIPLLQAYTQYLTREKIRTTRESITSATEGIFLFVNENLRFPCPANAALGPGNPLYGFEFSLTCDPAAIGLAAAGDCTPDGGICLAAGQRDLGGTAGATDPLELVLIGAVPVNTIRTPEFRAGDGISLDGWGNKLTYAVTARMTSAATFSSFSGQIGVNDEFGVQTAGINGDAHFGIISHGRDGNGAFTAGGARPVPCAPPAAGVDNENCNNDSIFVRGLGHYEAVGAGHYDDYSKFTRATAVSLWNFIPGTNHIRNANRLNVGVGTNAPAQKLDVIGQIGTDNTVIVRRICSKTQPTKCFNVDAIARASMGPDCPAGERMVGISLGTTQCAPLAFAPPIDMDCGALGQWVNGINTDGTVLCIP